MNQDLAIGFVVGLALGGGFALLAELQRRIRRRSVRMFVPSRLYPESR